MDLNINNPKYDDLFKTLFGQDRNVKFTKSLLNSILINIKKENNEESNIDNPPQIDQLSFLDKEFITVSKYSRDNKRTIVDVRAKDNKNKMDYLIEMQVLKDENLKDRSTFSSSLAFEHLYIAGDELSFKGKIYSINISYRNVFRPEDNEYKKYFHYLYTHEEGDPNNNIKNINYIFIELERFNIEEELSKFDEDSEINENNMLQYWLAFLKSVYVEYPKKDTQNTNNKPKIKSNLSYNNYNKLVKQNLINEAFQICALPLERKSKDNYALYLNSVDLEHKYEEKLKKKDEEITEKLKKKDEEITKANQELTKVNQELTKKNQVLIFLKRKFNWTEEEYSNYLNEFDQSFNESNSNEIDNENSNVINNKDSYNENKKLKLNNINH